MLYMFSKLLNLFVSRDGYVCMIYSISVCKACGMED